MTEFQNLTIDVENVFKRYDEKIILHGVSLKIRRGEFYILMGPNGSGKSTLLSIIAGTNSIDSGSIRILDKDIFSEGMQAKQRLGYVPQENFCSTFLTGRENLNYFSGLLGLSCEEARKRIAELLDMMELTADADRRVSEYSGGMRKKLEVATALLGDVDVLLLDEPTTGLDPGVRKEFLHLLKTINEGGTTILLVTHIGEDAEMASRVGFMVDGQIVAENEPEVLKEMSGAQDAILIDASPRNQELQMHLASICDEGITVESEEGFLIYCDQVVKMIPTIMNRLSEAGYEVLKIDTKPSTLEDVFYQLTDITVRGEVL